MASARVLAAQVLFIVFIVIRFSRLLSDETIRSTKEAIKWAIVIHAFIRPVETTHESQKKKTLWLDQRGTGLSTPVSEELLEGKTDQEKADYLKHFRADNIGMWAHSSHQHINSYVNH